MGNTMKVDKAIVALAAGAVLAAIILYAEAYFVAPPMVPAALYYAAALFVAGFGVSFALGHALLTAIGLFVGQVVYFLLTQEILPWDPMLFAILMFMVAQSLIALLGAWLGQALWRKRSAI